MNCRPSLIGCGASRRDRAAREMFPMSHDDEQACPHCTFERHAIIAGYGVPGRAVGEMLYHEALTKAP